MLVEIIKKQRAIEFILVAQLCSTKAKCLLIRLLISKVLIEILFTIATLKLCTSCYNPVGLRILVEAGFSFTNKFENC